MQAASGNYGSLWKANARSVYELQCSEDEHQIKSYTDMSEAQDPVSGTVPESSVVEESDEGELLEDIQEDDSVIDTPAASTPVPDTPAKAPPASTPGKVQPSSEVAGLQFNSPGGSNLKPDKNPFPAYGSWTVKDMAEITVDFPILSSKNKTTNELTRKNRPEARY